MFTLRRFIAPSSVRIATSSVVASASLTSSISSFSNSAINFQQRSNNNNYNNNNNNYNNNNNNNNNRSNVTTFKDEDVVPNPVRLSGFSRNGEPCLELTRISEVGTDGFKLLIAYPGKNVPHMDISFMRQIREKSDLAAGSSSSAAGDAAATTAAEGKAGNPRRARLFSAPILGLSIRIHPTQMAKVVAVLEGRSNETVIASKFATCTFKRNADSSVSYGVATQTSFTAADAGEPTSTEVVLTAVEAFMLEKFFSKMMIVGFDPSRETVKNFL